MIYPIAKLSDGIDTSYVLYSTDLNRIIEIFTEKDKSTLHIHTEYSLDDNTVIDKDLKYNEETIYRYIDLFKNHETIPINDFCDDTEFSRIIHIETEKIVINKLM
jgi:hypothetical protein